MTAHTVNWNNQTYKTGSYTVQVGEHHLALHRWYREEGPPVLLLPDFMEDRRVFLPPTCQEPLAPYLADRGYDVFVLELRGKGASWPQPSRHSDWGMHEHICEDIPAQLGMVARIRPDAEQFWLGRGQGGVLLASSYLRIETLPAPVLGIVHLGVARRLELFGWRKTLAYQRWHTRGRLAGLVGGQVNAFFSNRYTPESSRNFQSWSGWHNSPDWRDPRDDFDYRWAAHTKGLPSSLYFARQRGLWGRVEDCRNWIKELGSHDARLLVDTDLSWNREHFEIVADWMSCQTEIHHRFKAAPSAVASHTSI